MIVICTQFTTFYANRVSFGFGRYRVLVTSRLHPIRLIIGHRLVQAFAFDKNIPITPLGMKHRFEHHTTVSRLALTLTNMPTLRILGEPLFLTVPPQQQAYDNSRVMPVSKLLAG
jgi:hypothetical protein